MHWYHIMSLQPDTEPSRKLKRLSSPHDGHKTCPEMKVFNVVRVWNECQKVEGDIEQNKLALISRYI